MSLYSFKKSEALFQRAAKVIPCGIGGHVSPAVTVPGSFPYYATHGKGCRYWDLDGNEFLDFMCAYGPVVLGYDHPRVIEAAAKQRALGSVFNHPTPLAVELAEKLVSIIPIADWASFARNGSDVTYYALQVARQYTQKTKIIMARGAYHGTHPWSIHSMAGIIPSDYEHILQFTWNNADELRDLCKKHAGDIAGVILTPYHHPAFGDQVLPAPGFYDEVMRLRDEFDFVLISDDVRAGWRLNLGGSCEHFGFKPDLICYCKAIANGYVLSAIVGNDRVKQAASSVFFTGSFFQAAVEMAAALATIDELEKTDAIAHMWKMGELLQSGLRERAEKHGLQVSVTGPPTIPNMTFKNEANFLRMQRFSAEAARRGVFFHPHHNWFLSAAHQPTDIQQGLDVADECFAIVKKEFGG